MVYVGANILKTLKHDIRYFCMYMPFKKMFFFFKLTNSIYIIQYIFNQNLTFLFFSKKKKDILYILEKDISEKHNHEYLETNPTKGLNRKNITFQA